MLYLLKVISLIIVFDLFVAGVWFLHVNSISGKEKNSEHFEAAVIFMGDFNNNYTGLGQETLRRLNFAIDLNKSKIVENLLCVGGSRPTKNVYGAKLMKKYLEQNGVPIENVFVEIQSFDSKSNWFNALKSIEEQGWRSIALISSSIHLQRLKKKIINPIKHIKVSSTPFSYSIAEPRITFLELWRGIHHEWVAYFVYSLPEPLYKKILKILRPQS